MGDTPIYKNRWFFTLGWLTFWLAIYLWQIVRLGGIQVNQVRIAADVFLCLPLLVLWIAFFSQFVLPLRKFGDRWKIFWRVFGRLFGSVGPAIFIKNGVPEQEEGEIKRKGPGVLWLDSASGAVTRTATKIKKTLGPGVHFIDAKETIAGTLDLHRQTHSVGPWEEDDPFAEKKDEQTEDRYNAIQDRRKQVSALTRDGIEVVPNINVLFRVGTGFPKEGQPGSRFGYRIGVTPNDKKNEEEDKKAIRSAILGEGINPYSDHPHRRMAWNQLPAALAVDVWREYASKFNLEQFFTQGQKVPPPPPLPMEPTEEEIDPLTQAIQVGFSRDTFQTAIARILRVINVWMSGRIAKLEKKEIPPTLSEDSSPYVPPPSPARNETEMKTAFEVINEMVKARLTQEFVDYMDHTGNRIENHPVPSFEYKLLKDRGLQVLTVSVSNPRLDPAIDEKRIENWESRWIENANLEKEQRQRMTSLVEIEGQELAVKQYARWLSKALTGINKPADFKQALKSLLTHTRTLIHRDDQLRRKLSAELQSVDEILRWMEINGR